MNGLGRMSYAGRTRRTGPPSSMGFRPGTGLGGGVGVIFLLVAVSLFSHFPVFLLGWVIVFAMLPILGSLARSIALLLEGWVSAAPAASRIARRRNSCGCLRCTGRSILPV